MVNTRQLHLIEIIEYIAFALFHIIYALWTNDFHIIQRVLIYAVGMSIITVVCLILVSEELYKQLGYALCVMLGVHLIGSTLGLLAFGICIYMAAGTVLSIYGDRRLNYYYLIIVNMAIALELVMEYDAIVSIIPIQYYIMLIITCEIYLVFECFLVILYQQKVEEIQIQNELLNIAQKSKDEFLANMSHEIRTPMNAIVGMSELIMREEQENPKVSQYCHNIQSSGNNLLAIINDILDFSKIESGKMNIIKEPYSIAASVNEVVNTAMFRRGYRKVAIIVDMSPNIPRLVEGDEIRIRQIFTNIVTNALKFTEEGYIYISVTNYDSKGENWLSISVKDSGIGIKKEDLAHLFESFKRFDTKKNRSIEGTGLGLPICKRLVELMQGSIKIQSNYGRGTTVTIDIPQPIVDNSPSLKLNSKVSEVVTFLIRSEKVDEKCDALYDAAVEHMWSELGVHNQKCTDFEEFREIVQKDKITHALVEIEAYKQNREYINSIASKLKVFVICDPGYTFNLDDNIHIINQPFCAVSVISAFNGEAYYNELILDESEKTSFTIPNARILVVDDNEINRKVAEGIIKLFNAECILAKGGREAISILEGQPIDLVFMDHMMPDLDGVETTKLIRQNGNDNYRNVPVIALTANVINNSKQLFLKNGFQDFLPKPVKVKDMAVMLRRWLPEDMIVYDSTEADEVDDSVSTPVTNSVENNANVNDDNINSDVVRIDDEMALENMGGQRDLYKELLEYCLELEQQRWDEIQDKFESRDWNEYTILVHALKGGMRSLGIEELALVAQKQEHACKEGRYDDVIANHEPLRETYVRTHRSIEEYLRTYEV